MAKATHRCWMAGGKTAAGEDCMQITKVGHKCKAHKTEAMCRLAESKAVLLSFMSDATSLVTAAKMAGVPYSTACFWMKNDQEFAAAVRERLIVAKRYIADTAADTVLDRIERDEASPAELIFCMKNHPEVPWTDKHEVRQEVTEDRRIVIEHRHQLLSDPEVRRALERRSDSISGALDVTRAIGAPVDEGSVPESAAPDSAIDPDS